MSTYRNSKEESVWFAMRNVKDSSAPEVSVPKVRRVRWSFSWTHTVKWAIIGFLLYSLLSLEIGKCSELQPYELKTRLCDICWSDRTIMTVPVIDGIDSETFSISPQYQGQSFRGIFEWGLKYKETALPEKENRRRKQKTEPYK